MRAIRAALSMIVLGALLAVPPYLLVRLAGNPWPAEGVSLDAPLTDNAILGLLVALVWVLWAQFALCVVGEVAAAITDDRVSGQVPVAFAFQRQLARRLVTAVVVATVATPLLSTGGAVAAPGPAAAPAPRADLSLISATSEGGSGGAATASHAQRAAGHVSRSPGRASGTDESRAARHRTVTVMRLDTLWDIAERELGAGERWTEIASLNQGRTMNDGAIFASADHIRPGWHLHVPGPPNEVAQGGEIRVHEGDSLSSIAATRLADSSRWPALYRANRSVIGSDPDLIEPGQILRLPATHTPTAKTGEPESPVHTHPASTPLADDRRAPLPAYPDEGRTPHRDAGRSSGAETSGSESASETADSERPHQDGLTVVRSIFASAVMLAAGGLAILVANRRRQRRHRRPGRSVPALPVDLRAHERVLVEAGAASEADARFLDLALRHLTHGLRQTQMPLPDVGIAIMGSDHLTLLFTESAVADAPSPWCADVNRRVWSIARSAELYDTLADQPSAYPALVTIGVDADGRSWHLDLESLGDVTIVGPAVQRDDLIRFVVAELAVNAWSDGVQILLTDETSRWIADLNPARITVADRSVAAARVAATTGDRSDLAADLLARRRDDVAVDSAAPLVVVASPACEIQLRDEPGRSGAVLLSGAGSATSSEDWALRVTSTGALYVRGFDDELRAFGLPEVAAASMARLMAETSQVEDQPMPPSDRDTPLGELSTADGAIRPERTGNRGPDGDSSSLLPGPDELYLERAATTEDDLRRLAPSISDALGEEIEALDPALDDDVRAWFDRSSHRPKVRVLGPVDVISTAGDRTALRNIGGTVELIVYLACREHGATKDRAADDLGWSGATVQNRARDARRLLGQRSDGSEWLPDAMRSQGAKRRGVATYELDAGVLVDADLFRRLRTRAAARQADGVADLTRALALVVGEPFDQLRRGGYGWLLEGDRLDLHLCSSVADAAHLVVSQALVGRDIELAREASRLALLVDPHSEVVALDVAAIDSAVGSVPDSALKQRLNDGEEDPTRRTEAVLRRRGWLAS